MTEQRSLIDFEKARKSVMEILAGKVTTPTAIKVSLAMQEAAVDAVEVVRGKWLYNSIQGPIFRICSKCGMVYRIEKNECMYNFCPNCGAKMDKEA